MESELITYSENGRCVLKPLLNDLSVIRRVLGKASDGVGGHLHSMDPASPASGRLPALAGRSALDTRSAVGVGWSRTPKDGSQHECHPLILASNPPFFSCTLREMPKRKGMSHFMNECIATFIRPHGSPSRPSRGPWRIIDIPVGPIGIPKPAHGNGRT